MIFSSITFLMLFLPAVMGVYYLIKYIKKSDSIRSRNMVLLIASLIFYAFGGLKYLGIMILLILVNYFGGILLLKERFKEELRSFLLLSFIIVDSLSLLTFKLGNTLFEFILPIGISFYTFQAMSYIIDVYKGRVSPQKDFLDFALYISFFPQLIAGPIVQYKDIEGMLKGRDESLYMVSEGISRFIVGLGKKVIIANTMAECADKIWSQELSSLNFAVAWLGAITYTMQIYYDFSGYSDMAIGLGRIFGFSFSENFAHPYGAASIREFWRRWHISLSFWFKEYVYIPLGGNREGHLRTYINLIAVFLLTGLWHGATMTFLVWGLLYGLFLIIERAFLGTILEKNYYLGRIYTFLTVVLLWIIFRAESMRDALIYMSRLVVWNESDNHLLSFLSIKLIIILILSFIGCGRLGERLSAYMEKAPRLIMITFRMGILIISIALLMSGTYNPFIYYRF